MSSVGAVVGRKMRACSTELDASSRRTVNEASLVLKASVLREGRAASGGDLRLSGMNNAPLNAAYTVTGTKDPSSFLRAVGQWQIVENDTAAHYLVAGLLGSSRTKRQAAAKQAGTVGAFGGGTAGIFGAVRAATYTNRKGVEKTRKGKRALKIGGLLRAYAAHPGTRGRHPWRHGIDKGKPAALEVLRDSQKGAAIRGFKS